jgi:hypothetical protein
MALSGPSPSSSLLAIALHSGSFCRTPRGTHDFGSVLSLDGSSISPHIRCLLRTAASATRIQSFTEFHSAPSGDDSARSIVQLQRFEPPQPHHSFNNLLGSRTGARRRRFSLSVAPRFLWECLTSRIVRWFPAPASSNPACRFPALGFLCASHQELCGRFVPDGFQLMARTTRYSLNSPSVL